ncbi:MAG TPA: hypothetical protein VFJ76_06860 [Solirubrobacterales bacterium]|nr:hypothetical protein [Solirubrobacterales bacterium]
MRIPRPKLNYANVIATIALFVALGGAAVAAGLPKNSVGTNQIKRGAVTAAKIKRGAITSGKIAPKGVTAGKLGANAVLPGNLGNGIISTEKISDGAVTAAKIKNGVVTTNKLDNGAVTSAKLGENSVNSAKLTDGSVSVNKLGKSVIGQLQTSGLEGGRTLRGQFDVGGGGVKTEPKDEAHGAISYQFPLQTPPQATVVQMGQTSPDCAGRGGDNQTPQAAPGHLCIYIMGWHNIDEAANPLTTENDTKQGVGLVLQARDAGEAFSAYGVWAVTAP